MPAGAESLEAAMRRGRASGGSPPSDRAARAAAGVTAPKLDGVRMIASTDGFTILIGRTGPRTTTG